MPLFKKKQLQKPIVNNKKRLLFTFCQKEKKMTQREKDKLEYKLWELAEEYADEDWDN